MIDRSYAMNETLMLHSAACFPSAVRLLFSLPSGSCWFWIKQARRYHPMACGDRTLPLYREPKMPRNLEDRAVKQLVPCQFRHSPKSWCPNDLLLSSGYTAAGAAVRTDWILTAEDVQLRVGDIFPSNRIFAFK